VNQASKDIVFDPFDQLFYLSVPNTNPGGNTIAVFDPSTTQIAGHNTQGAIQTSFAISDDGHFSMPGVDGSSSVQRLLCQV